MIGVMGDRIEGAMTIDWGFDERWATVTFDGS
jgi:hypothetical protein